MLCNHQHCRVAEGLLHTKRKPHTHKVIISNFKADFFLISFGGIYTNSFCFNRVQEVVFSIHQVY